METVEVTANSNHLSSQLDQSRSIVKLREMELKRGTGLFLDDAISTNVPGVIMERRSHSGGQQLNIRGYGNGIGIRGINSNFDIQGTKFYLNGIPLTDAEGITILDDIDFSSLGNVEISKGPSGTIYGFAIAGVVNFQMQKPEKSGTTVGQDVIIGSDGLLRTTTRIGLHNSKSSLLVNYGHQEYDGFMPHTASHKNFANLFTEFSVSDRQNISAYLGFADSYDERNGELTIQQYENFDYSGNPNYIKNNAHSAVRTFRAGVTNRYTFLRGFSNTTTVFGTGQNMDNSSAGGWTDKTPLNYGFRSTFDNQFHLSKKISLSGITGIEMQKMHAQIAGYAMGADSTNLSGYNTITTTRSNQLASSFSSSYFTEWTLHLPYGFKVSGGVGISNMKLSLEDRLWAINNNRPGNEKLRVFEESYRNLVAPSFAVHKKIGESFAVYVSHSSGFKAPVTSNILISTTGQVNTGLKPEKGSQIEVGAKGNLVDGRLFFTVAAFRAKFENKFTTIAVPNPSNTTTLYTYVVNGGSMKNDGLEVLAKYDVVRSGTGFFSLLRPFASLTLSDFKYGHFTFERVGKNSLNKDSVIIENYSGSEVAGTPPVIFSAGADADTKIGVYANVHLNYRSGMLFTSDGQNRTDAYTLLNAKLGYRRFFGRWSLDVFAGASNITGEQYYHMVFVNQLPDAYIPAPKDANFFGGASLKVHL